MEHNILSQEAFWIINKKLAKVVGVEAALLLSDLITKKRYFKNQNQLINGEWFFNTAQNIEDDTTLSYHKQKQAIKILVKYGFLETKLIGLPSKLHFKIFESQVLNFLNTTIEEFLNLYNKNKPKKNKDNNNKNPFPKNEFENSEFNKEEKKESKKDIPPPKDIEIIYPFSSKKFMDTWDIWKRYKKEEHRFSYKSKISEQAALKNLVKLADGFEDKAIDIIMQSINNGWKGFFKLKNNTNGQNNESDLNSITAEVLKDIADGNF